VIVTVGDRQYPGMSIQDLSLTGIAILQRTLCGPDAHLVTRCETWEDVQEAWGEVMGMPVKQRKRHPEMLFITILIVWMARVSAGERVDLFDAVDVPPDQINFVLEPQDHAPKAKAPNSPKGSGRGASNQPRKGKKGRASQSTSAKRSTPESST